MSEYDSANLSKTKKIYNEYAFNYNFLHHMQTLWVDTEHRKIITKKAAKVIKNPSKILEYGCGSGLLTEIIVKQFSNSFVTSFDASLQMLLQMKKRENLKLKIIQASILAIPFKEQSFDILIGTYVLGGFEVNALLIAELSRVVKIGGILCLCEMVEPPKKKNRIKSIIHNTITSPIIKSIWGFRNFAINKLINKSKFQLLSEDYFSDRLLGSTSMYILKRVL